MTTYELFQDAGEVPYDAWRSRGIKVPIFDKDGTLSHANSLEPVEEVIAKLRQTLPEVYPQIALASNNHDARHVQQFAELISDELDVDVFAVSRADGFRRKPHPDMAQEIAERFQVRPHEIGVIGDRLWTDISFGRRIGAGAIALCKKAGTGDVGVVPAIRVVENIVVHAERMLKKRAA